MVADKLGYPLVIHKLHASSDSTFKIKTNKQFFVLTCGTSNSVLLNVCCSDSVSHIFVKSMQHQIKCMIAYDDDDDE